MTPEERVAKNEALFRDVNERIKQLALALSPPAIDWTVLCECSNPTCIATVDLPVDAFDITRADGARFALRPGHEDTAVERVVQTNPGLSPRREDARGRT